MKVKLLFLATACAAALAVPPPGASAQQPAAPAHVMVTAPEVVWGDPPPMFSAGARVAVISGDPGSAAPYVVRMQAPAGYKIAPHWHPTEENLTILSGTVALGMGEKFDEKAMKELPAGGYARLPAEMRHYLLAKTPVVIQVHGTGPFVLTYVNPADDPRNKPVSP